MKEMKVNGHGVEDTSHSRALASAVPEDARRSEPSCDLEKYRPYLEELDLSEEQAAELLTTLWEIMKSFVQLGFGTDSVQQIFPHLIEKAWSEESDDVDPKRSAGVPFNHEAMPARKEEAS